jgi:hypothetical protein
MKSADNLSDFVKPRHLGGPTTTCYYAEPLRFRYTNSTIVLAPLRLPLSASKGTHGHEKAEAQGVHIRDRCNSPSVHYLISH